MKTYPTTYKKDNKKAVIKSNEEWGEYQVWFYVDGKFQKDAIYHTDELEDAANTADHWVNN